MSEAIVHQEPVRQSANEVRRILELQSVTRSFGGLRAVDNCSLGVRDGSITGLIGPNGAGKSTLLNLISGFTRPNAGSITFDGTPVTRLPPHEIVRLGMVRTFQIPRPIPTMTVLENLVLAGKQQTGERVWNVWLRPGRVSQREHELIDEALAALAYVRLDHLRDAYAAHLSGGQKKLLEFARTLMGRPRVVLLDEPAAGVNRTLMRQLIQYIEEQRRDHGTTFLVVEHDMDLIARLCDRVVVMSLGTPICEGTFDEVRRNEAVLEAYLGGQFR